MEKARQPLRFVLSSGASFVLDATLYYLLMLLLGQALGAAAELACNIAARAVSSFFNFNVNRSLVFGGQGSYGGSLLRYYALAVPQLGASTLLLTLLARLLGAESALSSTLVKVGVDTALFVISFFIQKFWVFRKK